jgi:hypothetical protein
MDCIAPQAVRRLDEPPGAAQLPLLGQLVFDPTSLAATEWGARHRTALLADPDGPTRVLAARDHALAQGPHPLAPRTAADPDPANALARAVAYCHPRADEIRYLAFRQAGLPRGSGSVERGHGVVRTPRCTGAGRRWADAPRNPVLVVRTSAANARWARTWPTSWRELLPSGTQARHVKYRTRVYQRSAARGLQGSAAKGYQLRSYRGA